MSHDDRFSDGYDDDYEEIDDDYPEAAQQSGYVGDAETLLRRAIDIVATAPTMPLSSSPRIDRDEIIELLEEALARLPDELRQARWMLKERQEFVAKTRREADELLEAARGQAERMVQRTEVVRAAEQRARHVMETADNDSRRLRLETEDFLDQRLGSFEILLDRLSKTVAAGRQKLSIGDLRPAGADDRRRRPDQGILRPGPMIVSSTARALRINAGELRRQPGTHRHVELSIPPDDLDLGDDRVTGDVIVAVDLESTIDGIVVGGTASVGVVGRVPALPAPDRRRRRRPRRRALPGPRHRSRRLPDRGRAARPRPDDPRAGAPRAARRTAVP